ncbi:MAG: hypothetical protein C0171_04375 [Caldisphaera sp.]|uniref:hypothetical protein n=1 Tax=Caldisphaera sp. TaxID=2060322 RepID=UPI000CB411F0|nr:MAG: hypothetical protein C0201_03650 [Caldisphaera sp.]PMP90795.1 MAG: hypothetical protein C0171_04375 [Caldisphaera sp.]
MGELIPLVSESNNQDDLEFKAKLIYSYLLKIKLSHINDYNICDSIDFYSVNCSSLKNVLKFISCKSAIKMNLMSSYVNINNKIIEKNISLVMERCNNDFIRESLQKIKDSLT